MMPMCSTLQNARNRLMSFSCSSAAVAIPIDTSPNGTSRRSAMNTSANCIGGIDEPPSAGKVSAAEPPNSPSTAR